MAIRAHVRGRGGNAHRRLELPLSGIRKAARKTQVEVAEAAQMAQGDVSRLENNEDMKLSTLLRYAAALGAEVEIAFKYPNGARVFLAK
jgi:transcriptional regulator with XRE-family HTH domain